MVQGDGGVSLLAGLPHQPLQLGIHRLHTVPHVAAVMPGAAQVVSVAGEGPEQVSGLPPPAPCLAGAKPQSPGPHVPGRKVAKGKGSPRGHAQICSEENGGQLAPWARLR